MISKSNVRRHKSTFFLQPRPRRQPITIHCDYYRMTLSALARTFGGIVRPICFLLPYLRNDLRPARTSSAKIGGCSGIACGPLIKNQVVAFKGLNLLSHFLDVRELSVCSNAGPGSPAALISAQLPRKLACGRGSPPIPRQSMSDLQLV